MRAVEPPPTLVLREGGFLTTLRGTEMVPWNPYPGGFTLHELGQMIQSGKDLPRMWLRGHRIRMYEYTSPDPKMRFFALDTPAWRTKTNRQFEDTYLHLADGVQKWIIRTFDPKD